MGTLCCGVVRHPCLITVLLLGYYWQIISALHDLKLTRAGVLLYETWRSYLVTYGHLPVIHIDFE